MDTDHREYVSTIQDIEKAWKSRKRAVGELNGTRPKELTGSDFGNRAEFCCKALDPAEMPRISADHLVEVIRELSRENEVSWLYLRNVFIEGRLTIEGMRAKHGHALPILRFIQCHFDNGICFAGARLSELSLAGSRFDLNRLDPCNTDFGTKLVHINGANALVEGELNLSHLAPLLDPKEDIDELIAGQNQRLKAHAQQTLTVNLNRINIQGLLSAAHSTFVESAEFAEATLSGKPNYTFNVADATIRGRIHFTPGCRIEGGFNAVGLRCHGEAWFVGGHYTNKLITLKSMNTDKSESSSLNVFNFQSANFGNILMISQNDDKGKFNSFVEGNMKFIAGQYKDIYIERLLPATEGTFSTVTIPFFGISARRLALNNLEADFLTIEIRDTEAESIQATGLGGGDINVRLEGVTARKIIIKHSDSILNDDADREKRPARKRGWGNNHELRINHVEADEIDLATVEFPKGDGWRFVSIKATKCSRFSLLTQSHDSGGTSKLGPAKNFNRNSQNDKVELKGLNACIRSLELSGWGKSGATNDAICFDLSAHLDARDVQVGGDLCRLDLTESKIVGKLDLEEVNTATRKAPKDVQDTMHDWPQILLANMEIDRLLIAPPVYDSGDVLVYKLGCYTDVELILTEFRTKDAIQSPGDVPKSFFTAFFSIERPGYDREVRGFRSTGGREILIPSGTNTTFFRTSEALIRPLNESSERKTIELSHEDRILRLDTKSQVKEYLCLFTNLVWGEQGPFRIVTESELGLLNVSEEKEAVQTSKIWITKYVNGELLDDNEKAKFETDEDAKNYDYKTDVSSSFLSLTPRRGWVKTEQREEQTILRDIYVFRTWDSLLEAADFTTFGDYETQRDETAGEDKQVVKKLNLKTLLVEERPDEGKEQTGRQTWYALANIIYARYCFLAVFKLTDDGKGEIELLEDLPLFRIDPGSLGIESDFAELIDDSGEEGESETEQNDEFQWVFPIRDYPNFKTGSGGIQIELPRSRYDSNPLEGARNQSHKNDPTKEPAPFGMGNFFPSNIFKPLAAATGLADPDEAQALGQARIRKALVDLTDSRCSNLEDRSGGGWGDIVVFKTDRFRFGALATHYEDFKKGRWPGEEAFLQRINRMLFRKSGLNIPIFLNEFDKSPGDLIEGKAQPLGYSRVGQGRFERQRLLWLCRYHDDLQDTKRSARSIESGTFRRVARIYRAQGLTEGAKFIDEARIRQESRQLHKRIAEADWRLGFRDLAIWLAIFLACAGLSYNAGLIEWMKLSYALFISLLFWNLITHRFVKFMSRGVVQLWEIAFRYGFRYGLSLRRPFVTIIVFILIGWWGTRYLDERGLLVLETLNATAQIGEARGSAEVPLLNRPPIDTAIKASDVGCGSAVDHGLYALDMFIPLIEIDQDERCLIRPFDPAPSLDGRRAGDVSYAALMTDPWYVGKSRLVWQTRDGSVLRCESDRFELCDAMAPARVVSSHPTTWRLAQAFYVILGWIFVSATLLTVSGFLRRQSEGED